MDFNEIALKRPLLATSTLGGAPGLKASTSGEIGLECASKLVHLRYLQCQYFFPTYPRPAFLLESWLDDLQCAASCHILEWLRHGSDEGDFLSIPDSASLLGLLAKIKV